MLQELTSDAALAAIPLVILTTSRSEEDVVKSYGLHANCYITKPAEFTTFADVVRSTNDFWLGLVTLPPVTP